MDCKKSNDLLTPQKNASHNLCNPIGWHRQEIKSIQHLSNLTENYTSKHSVIARSTRKINRELHQQLSNENDYYSNILQVANQSKASENEHDILMQSSTLYIIIGNKPAND